jgi:hypothetical protein
MKCGEHRSAGAYTGPLSGSTLHTCLRDTLGDVSLPVTKVAQAELESGRVKALPVQLGHQLLQLSLEPRAHALLTSLGVAAQVESESKT